MDITCPCFYEGTFSNMSTQNGHVMQVGPMWQTDSQYATKWQVGHYSIHSHGVAVVQPESASIHTYSTHASAHM